MDRMELLDRLAAICGAPDIEEYDGTAIPYGTRFATATYWPDGVASVDACVHAVDESTNTKLIEFRKGWRSTPPNPLPGASRYGWHVVVFCDIDEARRIR